MSLLGSLHWSFLGGLLLAGLALGTAFVRLARHDTDGPSEIDGPLSAGFWGAAAAACLLTWWGILLGEIGMFTATALTVPPLILAVLFLLGSREGAVGGKADDPVLVVAVVAALAIMASAYYPPFEVRIEARDPGVYELTGAQLARTGSLAVDDGFVRGLDADTAEYFFPAPPEPYDEGPYDAYRFLGFYLESRDTGRVLPQFLPGYPVWVAATRLAVREGASSSGSPIPTGLAAVLLAGAGVIAMIFVGAALESPLAGSLAGLLLAANFVQAWFARYSAAELLAQLLVLVAVGALALGRRHGSRAFHVLGAVAFGLCWLTKAELLLLLVPLAALLLLDAASGSLDRRSVLFFWVPLGLLGLHFGAHGAWLALPYLHHLTLVVGLPAWLLLGAVVVGGTGLAVTLRWLARWEDARRRAWADHMAGRTLAGKAVRALAGVLAVAAAGYGYWFRPGSWGHDPDHVAELTWATSTFGWDANNMPELVWAVSAPVALLALLELLRRLWSRDDEESRPATTALLIFAVLGGLFLWHRQINPGLMWAYRRWVATAIPLSLLLAAIAWSRAWAWASRQMLGRGARRVLAGGVTIVVLVALGAGVGLRARQYLYRYDDVGELEGARRMIAEITDAVEPGSVVLFEPRNLYGLLRLEAFLDLDHGAHVLRIPDPAVDPDHLQDVVWSASRADTPVYLLTTGYLGRWSGPRPIPYRAFRWSLQKLEEIPRVLPSRVETLRIAPRLYRLEPTGGAPPLSGDLDVGGWDDVYVDGRTFYAAESDAEDRSFRWSRQDAVLWLPGLDADATALTLVADADTPPAREPQRVEVFLDSESLGAVTAGEGWQAYRFAIPADWRPGPQAPELLIRTDAFVGSEYGLPDWRQLGIKLDRVTWARSPDEER